MFSGNCHPQRAFRVTLPRGGRPVQTVGPNRKKFRYAKYIVMLIHDVFTLIFRIKLKGMTETEGGFFFT